MSRHTLEEFLNQTSERDRSEGVFELESERMLEINLDGLVWTKGSLNWGRDFAGRGLGLRNPFLWWLLVTCLVLYFYVRYP